MRRGGTIMTDLPAGFRLRHAREADHPMLNRVCLLTGNSGEDGTDLQDDPDLLGLAYAVPYQVRDPDFAFVLEDDGGVCGYVLGTPDTAGFVAWLDAVWYPPLRARLRNPGPDAALWQNSDWVRWRICGPIAPPSADMARYPAHLHIDLLPRARGKGIGRAMIGRQLRALAEAGCPGVHLEVATKNLRAQDFYRKLGFQLTATHPDFLVMARTLGSSAGG